MAKQLDLNHGSRRRTLPRRLVACLFGACLLPAAVQADERRQSGTDTARQSARSAPLTSPSSGIGTVYEGRTLQEQIDPAVRQYWSDKCVQQRARGWGHTGDCRHPAYSGAGSPPVILVPYGYPTSPYANEPRARSRGHLNMPAPTPGGRGHLR